MSNRSEQVRYHLNNNGDFIITGYNSSKLFSSFLPGVAGRQGIPMWSFYVNRGQCLCSMGIEGKHKPIMEFLPANWAYNLTPNQGFRTFVKITGGDREIFYEPFRHDYHSREMDVVQRMVVSASGLRLEEENRTLGLNFAVEYFNVPQDSYAGLIRVLHIQNNGGRSLTLEVLDGLPLIIPYGIDNYGLKNIRRLVEAFVEVTNFEQGVPFFKGKVEPADRPDVVRIKKGNFYLGFINRDGTNELVKTIVDPVKIFGMRGDYHCPDRFLDEPLTALLTGQILENRLPSAMGAINTVLTGGSGLVYSSVIGHANSVDELQALVPQLIAPGYIGDKATENRAIIDRLTQNNFICSNEPVLDHYARQNFLDNALRGGFPYTIRGKKASAILHLYSRKHGDLERDYNDFRLNPTPYSQGNGNFRDVNQNRRCDLLFNPEVGSGNVEQFFNLIQLDGFNPLVIKEVRFCAPEAAVLQPILAGYLEPAQVEAVTELLREPFTPGELLLQMHERGLAVKGDTEEFLGDVLGHCRKQNDTAFLEGYWTDHWTYNLDLVENYLMIYPEKKHWLLFDNRDFTYHEDAHHVAPRADKYVVWDGNPVQLHGVVHDEEHEARLNRRTAGRNLVHTGYGEGTVYHTSLFEKMICLVTNKLASLDPSGVGLEMEADKPNWYDALNGLPGQIGSSLNETLELKRLLQFMLAALKNTNPDRQYLLFDELYEFLTGLGQLLADSLFPYEYWDKATTLKEKYRFKTRFGIHGTEQALSGISLTVFLQAGLDKVNSAVEKAWNRKQQVISTYFINKVTDYELLYNTDEVGNKTPRLNSRGLPCFKALDFRLITLPLFLEGPVHYLRCRPQSEDALKLVENIRKSGLYDTALGMYKVNECLDDQPMEIGRARTFSPGWFENESIWLHMEYKYLLEILRNGLYDAFYRDFRQVLVPFMKPEVYGRSILENSSFIVSSANPDPSIHGGGFVARLSGATAEFINILTLMSMGEEPFKLTGNGELQLALKPVLPAWLFTSTQRNIRLECGGIWKDITIEPDTFSFMFLGRILVTYRNPKQRDTFGPQAVVPVSGVVETGNGSRIAFNSGVIGGELARKIRNREVTRLEILLG